MSITKSTTGFEVTTSIMLTKLIPSHSLKRID